MPIGPSNCINLSSADRESLRGLTALIDMEMRERMEPGVRFRVQIPTDLKSEIYSRLVLDYKQAGWDNVYLEYEPRRDPEVKDRVLIIEWFDHAGPCRLNKTVYAQRRTAEFINKNRLLQGTWDDEVEIPGRPPELARELVRRMELKHKLELEHKYASKLPPGHESTIWNMDAERDPEVHRLGGRGGQLVPWEDLPKISGPVVPGRIVCDGVGNILGISQSGTEAPVFTEPVTATDMPLPYVAPLPYVLSHLKDGEMIMLGGAGPDLKLGERTEGQKMIAFDPATRTPEMEVGTKIEVSTEMKPSIAQKIAGQFKEMRLKHMDLFVKEGEQEPRSLYSYIPNVTVEDAMQAEMALLDETARPSFIRAPVAILGEFAPADVRPPWPGPAREFARVEPVMTETKLSIQPDNDDDDHWPDMGPVLVPEPSCHFSDVRIDYYGVDGYVTPDIKVTSLWYHAPRHESGLSVRLYGPVDEVTLDPASQMRWLRDTDSHKRRLQETLRPVGSPPDFNA